LIISPNLKTSIIRQDDKTADPLSLTFRKKWHILRLQLTFFIPREGKMMRFRFCLAILLVPSVFLVGGCSSSYLVDRPATFEPCHTGEKAQLYSTAALIKSFEGKHWTIQGADVDGGLVRAKACRGQYCISVDANIEANGQVEVLRTPGQYISRSGGRLLQHWMRHLNAAYQKFRCLSPETLQAEVANRTFPPFDQITPETAVKD
jgi:hypothetical protein